MFIDYARIIVKSGDGGRGHISFRREKFVPKGGPDGGNGGKGGDVAFVGNPHLNTLIDFRYKRNFKAPGGQPGSYANRTGKSGKTLVIQVPLGTVVKDNRTGEVLADITEPYEQKIVARGGRVVIKGVVHALIGVDRELLAGRFEPPAGRSRYRY